MLKRKATILPLERREQGKNRYKITISSYQELLLCWQIRLPLARLARFPAQKNRRRTSRNRDAGEESDEKRGGVGGGGRILPGPSGALGDEVVAGDDELGDAEDALLLEGGDGAVAGDPLHRALESLVELLREDHLAGGFVEGIGRRGFWGADRAAKTTRRNPRKFRDGNVAREME